MRIKMKLFSAVALITGLFVGIAPSAQAEELIFPCGDSATYSVLMPEGIAGSRYICTGDLILDESVKVIGMQAFKYSKLTSVIIPNSVLSIENEAFANTGITSVIIGDSVTSIGMKAFENNNLANVTFGKSVLSIGYSAFAFNRLTKVMLPNSLKQIGSYAFQGNLFLTQISIPEGLEVLDPEAFQYNFRLDSILYCGKLTAFPKKPSCLTVQTSVKPTSATPKKTTITCVKGKLTKKVTAVKPVCPAGYKKKA